MKRVLSFAVAMVLMWASFCLPVQAKTAPTTIAGITLGQPLLKFEAFIDRDTTLRMWDREYLSRVELKPMPGIKSGYISFANCENVGTVLRVKVKYKDSSLRFFQKIYDTLAKRYGSPENRGNPFGTLKVWKWGLTSAQGHSISMILVHNDGKDETYSHGNTLRLTDRTLVVREQECMVKKRAKRLAGEREGKPDKKAGFQELLPH
jgi:hypothetical protein